MNATKLILVAAAAWTACVLTSTCIADEKPTREETIKYINRILRRTEDTFIDPSEKDTGNNQRRMIKYYEEGPLIYEAKSQNYSYTFLDYRPADKNYPVGYTISSGITMKDFIKIIDQSDKKLLTTFLILQWSIEDHITKKGGDLEEGTKNEAYNRKSDTVRIYYPGGDTDNFTRLKNAILRLKEIDSEEKDPFLD